MLRKRSKLEGPKEEKEKEERETWRRVGMFYVEVIIPIRSQSPHEHRNLDRIVGLARA